MRFVVMAWDGDDPDAKGRRAAVRPVHLENIQPFVDDGHVLVGGAMLDDQGDMIGSTLVVEFDSRADLDAWITADPYVTEGSGTGRRPTRSGLPWGAGYRLVARATADQGSGRRRR